jgi:flavodoxin
MNALVVYDSQYGNTERIAHAIASALRASGPTRIVRADPAQPIGLEGVDLLVVGCPTQGWRPTRPIQSFLAVIPTGRLHELAIACFDTRFHKARWLTGSAAAVMDKKLQQAGARLAVPPESFFVTASEGPLEPGELERAAAWAGRLARTLAQQPAARTYREPPGAAGSGLLP